MFHYTYCPYSNYYILEEDGNFIGTFDPGELDQYIEETKKKNWRNEKTIKIK